MIKKAVYAGTFDVLTNGHLWMIQSASRMFDELVIAIGENPNKKCIFSLAERLELIWASIWPGFKINQNTKLNLNGCNISVDSFSNKYLMDYAVKVKAPFIVRGLRNMADYEYEKSMLNVNRDMNKGVETVFLMPPKNLSEVSSSMVKSLIGPDRWDYVTKGLVPLPVFKKLKEMYK